MQTSDKGHIHWGQNVVFVTYLTLGYPRVVLSLEQGLTFQLEFVLSLPYSQVL